MKERTPAGKEPKTDNRGGRRALGLEKEILAADYLRSQGYEILARNYYCRSGEIDIIARNDGYLVFAEVKYRSRDGCGLPQEAVDRRKIRRIVRAARYYLYTQGIPSDTPCRFDVITILGSRISVIKHAFEAD